MSTGFGPFAGLAAVPVGAAVAEGLAVPTALLWDEGAEGPPAEAATSEVGVGGAPVSCA